MDWPFWVTGPPLDLQLSLTPIEPIGFHIHRSRIVFQGKILVLLPEARRVDCRLAKTPNVLHVTSFAPYSSIKMSRKVTPKTKHNASAVSTDKGCSRHFYADHLSRCYPLEISATSGRLMCHFKLVALVGHLIRLSIESVQIEADNCVTDSLAIYDSLLPIRSTVLYRYEAGTLAGKAKDFSQCFCFAISWFPLDFLKPSLGRHLRSKTDPCPI